jgi:uncharacterized glyoxalase superfamily protein PhnB
MLILDDPTSQRGAPMPARKPKKKATAKARPRAKSARKPAAAPKKSAPAKGLVKRQEPESLRLRAATPSLTVNDIDKSLTWYRDVLGFTLKERWEDKGKLLGVELVAGGVSFYLGQDDWQKGRHRTKGVGFRIYCSTVQDVDGLAARVRARGGQLLDEPHDESWGGRAFAVVDPDGFKITIASE